jgi:hypothetical protein
MAVREISPQVDRKSATVRVFFVSLYQVPELDGPEDMFCLDLALASMRLTTCPNKRM